ncbi:MAG: SufS family cysteine desulfurase [Candidatus Micrarchaeota archaeon]|nr:SufS family cysteine desulfurase [Candidatus Micrarchaeota archaeon]MDE1824603.1 SufS family cysteine desulfurase [Candidatus Micrarchaeota archaeon]
MALDADRIRMDFPILESTMHGKRLVYLDNAATTQKPRQVIEKISDYYKTYNANIHRGMYEISIRATEEYVRSKELTANFINADSYRNIVYTRNTTESLNVLAMSLGEEVNKGDTILISTMEHHSNIVPWQMLAKRKGAVLEYARVADDRSSMDMSDVESKLGKKPRIVSITMASNVLGTVNDAKRITKLAHDNGALVILDGAQSVPHMKTNVKDLDCDFLAFSSHKMLGPAGIGVLYGKDELLEEMNPVLGGGDMIRSVDFQSSTWNELPWKFEAGTSNIEGGIGFGAAIEYLGNIGMENVKRHEDELTGYALKRFSEIPGMKVHGLKADRINDRIGVVSFSIEGAHPHDIAQIFDSEGIAIRAGHHCAMPLVNSVLNEDSVARMSFYVYNNKEDVDKVVSAIDRVKTVLRIKSKN